MMTPNASVILTEMNDGTGVLLDMSTKFYYTLNSTGVLVWKTAEESPDIALDDLAHKVHDDFDVELETARGDVEDLIRELVKEKLMTCDELA